MKRVLTLLFLLSALATGLFLARHHILWLDSFEGQVLGKAEDSVATVRRDATQNLSTFTLDIETDDGRRVTVEVDQLTYFDARVGLRASKRPFGSKITLLDP